MKPVYGQFLTLGACARVTVVVLCVCVCLSVTSLTATYRICESQVRCYKVPYGIPNAWFVWISPKTLCSSVLAIICSWPLLSTLPGKSSVDRLSNMRFLLRYKVSSSSNSFCKTTANKLLLVKLLQSFLTVLAAHNFLFIRKWCYGT